MKLQCAGVNVMVRTAACIASMNVFLNCQTEATEAIFFNVAIDGKHVKSGGNNGASKFMESVKAISSTQMDDLIVGTMFDVVEQVLVVN